MVRISVFVCVILLLVCGAVTALAQQPADQANEIRCSGGGAACKTGFIPVFSTNGGSALVTNSKVSQSGTGIAVAGNVSATGFVKAGGTVSGGAGSFSGNVNAGGTVSGGAGSFSGNVNAGGTVFGSAGNFGGNVNAATLSAGGTVSGGAGSFSGNVSAGGNVFGVDGSFSGNLFGTVGTLNNLGAGAGSALFAENNDLPQTLQLNNVVAPADNAFMEAQFNGFGTPVFFVTTTGNTAATGTKSAVVPLRNGKMVKMFSAESPEVWFEDYGTASLVGGVVTVNLDATFAQTVTTGNKYKVFLTPNGDCHGLYVEQKTPTSFEVRELGGGTSSVEFDYRISAHRKGYENTRLPVAEMPKFSGHAAAH